MTPREFVELVDGWKWRDDREWERAAWTVAYLLQPWSKRPLKPADLLRPLRESSTAPQPATFKEWLAQTAEKQAAREPHGDR